MSQNLRNFETPDENVSLVEEVLDPSHLSPEELEEIDKAIRLMRAGVTLVDDPIARGLINGRIMSKELGYDLSEEGYEEGGSAADEKEHATTDVKRELVPEQKEQLLCTLKARFEKNIKRHKGMQWAKLEARLNEASPEKLWSLNEMERTGGEPDVVGFDKTTGEYEFYDCPKESPKGRRNICYDRKGQEEAERQGYTPAGNAVDMAAAMRLGGILNRDQYKNKLQKFGKFDKETWSWIDTPEETRKQGVALAAGWRDSGVLVGNDFPNLRGNDVAFRGWLRV